jgi:undecaprenyl-diphosphatase
MQQFELWQVLVLAVVQGITEFLPISSDGHLALAEPLIWQSSQPRPNAMDLTIVLHMGTLGSILVYYRERIWRLLGEDRRVLWLMCVGTVPAVALVLTDKFLFDEWIESTLKNTLLTGCMLMASGSMLLIAQRVGKGSRDYRSLRTYESVLIGCAQATAILPGLSRSGTTISSALALGLSRPAAATYSFLLAIPALAGAGVYKGYSMLKHPEALSTSPANLTIGCLVSFLVGLVAIAVLTRVLARGRLHYFAWYCIVLGVVVIGLHLR